MMMAMVMPALLMTMPLILISALADRREGRAPAIGQQILARLTQIGPGY